MKRQSFYHIETSLLICSANQLTGFCMMAFLAFNELTDCQWYDKKSFLPNIHRLMLSNLRYI